MSPLVEVDELPTEKNVTVRVQSEAERSFAAKHRAVAEVEMFTNALKREMYKSGENGKYMESEWNSLSHKMKKPRNI